VSDDARYVRVACACGAYWIEDRMEPGPTCPGCGQTAPWAAINEADLFVEGPGMFDASASHLIDLLSHWGFHGSLVVLTRGRVDVGRWTCGGDRCDPRWEVVIDIAAYKETNVLRSVIVGYHVDGKLVLWTSVLSSIRLLELVAAITRTMLSPSIVEAA